MNSANASLDTFLAQLADRLQDLPAYRRDEILSETRAHLGAMVAARRTDGQTESAAMQDALRCFGDADLVGQEIAREWKRAPRYETQGTPLPRREKVRTIVRSLVVALLLYPALLSVTPWLKAHHLQGIFYLAMPIGFWLFALLRFRKSHRQGFTFTPQRMFGFFLGFAMMMTMGLRIQFADSLRGTPLDSILDTYFIPVILVLSIISMLWMRRENQRFPPWRRFKRYSSNPIAAEQEYHFNTSLSMLLGPLMIGVGSLISGVGIGHALLSSLGIAALFFLLWRFRR